MDGGREEANGLLNALIGWCEFELGVECFEVMAEFLSKRQSVIGCRNSRFRHGGQEDDTGSAGVATTGCRYLFIRRFV